MNFGILVRNMFGHVALDMTDRLTYHHSSVSTTAHPLGYNPTEYAYLKIYKVVVSVPGLTDDGTWFIGAVRASTSQAYDSTVVYIQPGQVEIRMGFNAEFGGPPDSLPITFDIMRC